MGYRVGGGASRATTCGWFWWKKTCVWIETGLVNGTYEEWFNNYPLDNYPTRQMKCTTCGEIEWR